MTFLTFKTYVCLIELSINKALWKLTYINFLREMNCIYSCNIFLSSSLLIIFIWAFFIAIIGCCCSISFVLKVFLKPDEKYGLIFSHFLTKKHRDVEFRVIGKHNFLLNTSSCEGTSSDKLISKIGFDATIMILYAVIVMTNYHRTHWNFLIDNSIKIDCLDNPSDGQ